VALSWKRGFRKKARGPPRNNGGCAQLSPGTRQERLGRGTRRPRDGGRSPAPEPVRQGGEKVSKGLDLASYRRAIDDVVEPDEFVDYRRAYDYAQGSKR